MAQRWLRLAELRREPVQQAVPPLPSLVIGLGGSGTATARRIKRLVRERHGSDSAVRFLFFDCDQNAYGPGPGLADIEPEEQANIVAIDAEAVYALVKAGLRANIAKWLPDAADVTLLSTATGAGGIRPVGRFALFCRMGQVQPLVDQAAATLNSLRSQIVATQSAGVATAAKTRVYVVNSLCGGTGSSLFLDLALIARRALGGRGACEVVGVEFMPSVFERELKSHAMLYRMLQANAYGALKEIEYWCRPETFQDGTASWSVDYGNETITVDGPVLDQCFLVELRNSQGKQLASQDEVFEMAARSVAHDIDSVMGGAIRSAERNIFPVLRTGGLFPGGRVPVIHGLAASSVRVPLAEMTVYGGLRTAEVVVHDHLLGLGQPAEEVRTQIERVMHQANVDLAGADHRTAVILEEGLAFGVGMTREDLEAAAAGDGYHGETGRAHYAGREIEARRDRLAEEVAGTLLPELRRRRTRLLTQAVAALEQALAEVLSSRGLTTGLAFLRELLLQLQHGADTLVAATKAYEDQGRAGLLEALDAKIGFLKEFGGLGNLLFRPHVDELAAEDALGLLQRFGDQEYGFAVRRAAYQLLASESVDAEAGSAPARPGLMPVVKQWLALAAKAGQHLERASVSLGEEAAHQRPTDASVDSFVLDQSVIPAREIDGWIAKAGLQPAVLAGETRKALGGDPLDVVRYLRALARPDEDNDEAAALALADGVAAGCASRLKGWLLTNAGLLNVVQGTVGQSTAAESMEKLVSPPLRAKVQALAQACRPFWTAGPAINSVHQYETFAGVGVPCPAGTLADPASHFELPKEQTAGLVEGVALTLSFVPAPQPFRLDFVARAYGSAAYHFDSINALRAVYLHPSTNRALHHIDRHFVDELPDLSPEEAGAAEARELFAWGVAYGYIASRGNSFYFGTEERRTADGRVLAPRYASDWEGRVPLAEAEYEPIRKLGVAPDRTDQLDTGRAAAMSALFRGDASWRDRLREARKAYLDRWGRARVAAEVEAYRMRLDEAWGRARPEMRKQLEAEKAALQSYIESI